MRAVYGQGTVEFSNFINFKLSTQFAVGGETAPVPTTPGLLEYGIFYATGTTQPATLNLWTGQFGVNSTTDTGRIASPVDGQSLLTNVPLGPETSPGETDVWMQIGAWSASYGTDWQAAKAAFYGGGSAVYWGLSEIVNINALGNPLVSGVTIWQSAAGTNPRLIHPFVVELSPLPEPGTLALVGLGIAALVTSRRRK